MFCFAVVFLSRMVLKPKDFDMEMLTQQIKCIIVQVDNTDRDNS